jgi:hypothetical protein
MTKGEAIAFRLLVRAAFVEGFSRGKGMAVHLHINAPDWWESSQAKRDTERAIQQMEDKEDGS